MRPAVARRRCPAWALAVLALTLMGSVSCGGTPPPPAAARGPAAKAAALQPTSVVLDWVGNEPQALGFWIAQGKGWYRQAGLDVTIVPGRSGALALQLLAAGKTQFALSDAPTVLQSAARGLPVQMVALMTQQDSYGLDWFADGSIHGPRDFPGKRIGFVAGSPAQLLWPDFARAAGIDPASVHIVSVTPQDDMQALAQGRIDVVNAPVGAPGLIAIEHQTGRPIEGVLLARYFPLLGYGIVTTRSLVQDQPKEVRAFVQATARAWAWMVSSPQAAVAYGVSQVEAHIRRAGTPAVLAAADRQIVPLIRAGVPANEPYGWSSRAAWRRMIAAFPGLAPRPAVGLVVTNAFTRPD